VPIDQLTKDFLKELEQRNALPAPTAAPVVGAQTTGKSLWETIGTEEEPDWLQMQEGKSGALHFAGAALWHAFDVGLLGLPGIALGEETYYKWDELGTGAKAGAVLGEAAGFLLPLGLIGKTTSKGVAAVSKYGTKAATARASDAAKVMAADRKLEDAGKIGSTVGKVFATKAAKEKLPLYQMNTSTIAAAQKEMGSLITGALKKEFPTIADDLVEEITQASLKGLSQKGVHINSIGRWVERALNTKFSIADQSKITSYVGRAAELTANFSLYNLIDDGIKSVAVEGHEFDPVADIGQALMFSAFLPAVEAFPGGGKLKFFKTRKDVKSGLNKIKTMDYDDLDVAEVNAIFKILSNNNRLQHSSFAVEASKRVGNAFKDTPEDKAQAVLHLKNLFSNFNPDKVYREMYGKFGMDLIKSVPRMTIGAAYFTAATLLDENMLRNVDPEVLGAHLLVGALFTRRYKPIVKEKFPTLNKFDRKVEFLRTLGFESEQIKYLGEAYGLRADLGHAYAGLLNHPIMRQITETINTGENKKQSVEGKDGVGELNSDVHSLIQHVHK